MSRQQMGYNLCIRVTEWAQQERTRRQKTENKMETAEKTENKMETAEKTENKMETAEKTKNKMETAEKTENKMETASVVTIPDFAMRYVSRYLGHDAIRIAILVY